MGEMRDQITEFQKTMRMLSREDEKSTNNFKSFMDSVLEEKALDRKTKELIALGAAITAGCKYCIALHVRNALSEGATRDEVIETASVASMMGGSPALTYVTEVRKTLEEFESE